MSDIVKIEKIEKILKNTGRLRQVDLIKQIEKECQVTYVTARKIIKDAVELGRIKEEERRRGKEPILYYTVHFDIEEDEKNIFGFCERALKQFDFRLDVFKDKFANLTTDEKIKGLESFELLFLRLHVATQALWHNFGQSNEWKVLLDKVNSRVIPMNDLGQSVSVKEMAIIKTRIMEKKVDTINDAFNDLDEFLNELVGR